MNDVALGARPTLHNWRIDLGACEGISAAADSGGLTLTLELEPMLDSIEHRKMELRFFGDSIRCAEVVDAMAAAMGYQMFVKCRPARRRWVVGEKPTCGLFFDHDCAHDLPCILPPGHHGHHRALSPEEHGEDITWPNAECELGEEVA